MRQRVVSSIVFAVAWLVVAASAAGQSLEIHQINVGWGMSVFIKGPNGTTVLLDHRAGAHRGTGSASSMEWAVSFAASICLHLHRYGQRIRLVTESGRLIVSDTGDGTHNDNAVLDALAALQATPQHEIGAMNDPAHGQELIAILGASTPESLSQLLVAMASSEHATLYKSSLANPGDDGTLRVHSLHNGRLLHVTRIPVGSYNVQEAFGWIVTPSLDRGTFCVLTRAGRLLRRVQVAPSSHDACFVMTA